MPDENFNGFSKVVVNVSGESNKNRFLMLYGYNSKKEISFILIPLVEEVESIDATISCVQIGSGQLESFNVDWTLDCGLYCTQSTKITPYNLKIKINGKYENFGYDLESSTYLENQFIQISPDN